MKSHVWIASAISLTLLGPSTVEGQFGRLVGGGGAATKLEAAMTPTLDSYGTMLGASLTANAHLALANGNKDLAAQLKETAQALSTGSPKDRAAALVKATVIDSSARSANSQQLSTATQLSESAKTDFVEGLKSYATAVMQVPSVLSDSKGLASAVRSVNVADLSPLEAPRMMKLLSDGKVLAESVPANAAGIVNGLRELIGFARSRSIPLPPQATSALDAIK